MSPTSTLPSSSNGRDPSRRLSMFPVADQVPVTGSYNSAEVSSVDHHRPAAYHQHPAVESRTAV